MHWADEAVLNRQRADFVHRMWTVHRFQAVTGLLYDLGGW